MKPTITAIDAITNFIFVENKLTRSDLIIVPGTSHPQLLPHWPSRNHLAAVGKERRHLAGKPLSKWAPGGYLGCKSVHLVAL